MANSEKSSRSKQPQPFRWGISAIKQLESDLSLLISRLGFDREINWNLISLEKFEGRMDDLIKFSERVKRNVDELHVPNRKTLIWVWPNPDTEIEKIDGDSAGTMRVLHVPKGTPFPVDHVKLEMIDVYSQLMSRIGIEILRFQEFLQMWKHAANSRMYISTATMSRSLLESCAVLFSLVKQISVQWSKTKQTSGEIHMTATGGRVDRERLIEIDNLRKILWDARNAFKFHDTLKRNSGLIENLIEWRHPDLENQLRQFGITIRKDAYHEPQSIPDLMRTLSESVITENRHTKLINDYELLCNIVHPSGGGFILNSSAQFSDSTYGFSFTQVGANRGRMYEQSNDESSESQLTAFGTLINSISQSAFIAGTVTLRVIEMLVAISDDVSLTVDNESLFLHKTWRYPRRIQSIDCMCVWKKLGGCNHIWGTSGPNIASNLQLDFITSWESR